MSELDEITITSSGLVIFLGLSFFGELLFFRRLVTNLLIASNCGEGSSIEENRGTLIDCGKGASIGENGGAFIDCGEGATIGENGGASTDERGD